MEHFLILPFIYKGYIFEKIGLDDSFYTIKYNGEKIRKEKSFPNHSVAVETLINDLVELNIVSYSTPKVSAVSASTVFILWAYGNTKYPPSEYISDVIEL